MAELSSFLIDAFPEAAVLARRWRVERANAMARHYLPSLQEGEPLPQELRPLLGGYTGGVYTIDARRISEEHLGGYFPNTPMLSAIVQVSRVLEPGRFIADMEASFRHKFATKPQVIQGNMNCLIQSMKEVRQA